MLVNIFKTRVIVAVAVLSLMVSACSKTKLDKVNPNQPGEAALLSEDGMMRAALGVYSKFGLEYFWLSLTNHNIMGDNTFSSVGNYSWRWANQPAKITLDDGVTVLTPPQGGTQGFELKSRNSRAFSNDNVFFNEWASMYLVNNQANVILAACEDPRIVYGGTADAIKSKKAALKAWSYWWKGFAYSRIGSLYIAGIINDKPNETNSDFKSSADIIAEANANFDKAVTALNEVTDVAAYTTIISAAIPSMTKVGKGGNITVAEFKRHINTYKARNILVNKKIEEMTNADWTQILTLTADGLTSTDKILTMRTADANAVLGNSSAGWSPWRLLTGAWEFASERWVQDFQPNDARKTRNLRLRATPVVNNSSRGFQYGTRWDFIPIEQGGDYVSQTVGIAEIPMGCTYEENALTRAEALIRTGAVEDGLKLIDAVRTYQRASLPALSGSSLNEAQAFLQLRSERRIALFLKNTSFYDARRFGWASKNGKRTGVVVIYTGGVVNTNATIEYNYLDYFDVPLNEIDFNSPASGSAPVVFPY